ncbi:MAG TPA: secretin N-terminal domain-containing protein [Planctomycetota bacterium]|nr:secretin N-terminal domain-containing protein [Planctomycetota bacterium]
MILQRFLALASILLLSLACQTAYASPGGSPRQADAAGLLPPAKSALQIEVGDQGRPSLGQMLRQLGQATGVTFTSIDSVEQQLESRPCGVLSSVTVPPERAWLWVESLLEQEGFTLGILSASEPWLVAVYMHPMAGRPNVHVSVSVPAARIEALAEHPALLVTTTLELPHTDVRQLGNSLRGLTTDPTGQQNVVPVGNTNSVILTGTGRSVHQLVTLLEEIDAREAVAQERRAQEGRQAGAQGEGDAR